MHKQGYRKNANDFNDFIRITDCTMQFLDSGLVKSIFSSSHFSVLHSQCQQMHSVGDCQTFAELRTSVRDHQTLMIFSHLPQMCGLKPIDTLEYYVIKEVKN